MTKTARLREPAVAYSLKTENRTQVLTAQASYGFGRYLRSQHEWARGRLGRCWFRVQVLASYAGFSLAFGLLRLAGHDGYTGDVSCGLKALWNPHAF